MKLSTLFEMAYPASFDMQVFKSLKSFAARRRYATERLPKLGEGSSRVVFEIDEFKVLKLAKNPKGIAQNEAEGGSGVENMYDIVAKTIDNDEENWLWVEMEKAKKINAARFQQLTGLQFKRFAEGILYEWQRHERGVVRDPLSGAIIKPPGQDALWDNEFFTSVIDMIVNFDLPAGDYAQLKHYGEVAGRCVIIDYGLNREVMKTHYSR